MALVVTSVAQRRLDPVTAEQDDGSCDLLSTCGIDVFYDASTKEDTVDDLHGEDHRVTKLKNVVVAPPAPPAPPRGSTQLMRY